ncbi:MAG: PD-(D/E)XK nuclease-like domain-containing protein [Bdellovibrionales bacterium]
MAEKEMNSFKLCLPDRLEISAAEYHGYPAASSGQLKRLLRSPAHYKHELQNPTPPTGAQNLGWLIHLAVLEPDVFHESTVVIPKFEGRGARSRAEEWEKEHAGKHVVKSSEMQIIKGVLKSLSSHRTARELLASGHFENSFFWQDPVTGLVCKCRPDLWREGLVVDIKTTLNASPQEFPRTIANMMYHLQGAFYMDGVSAVLGEPIERFLILAVEKTPPYAVATYTLDEATLDVGRMFYRRALRVLRQCKMRNHYPGYPDRIISTSLPSWAWPVETEESDFAVRAV